MIKEKPSDIDQNYVEDCPKENFVPPSKFPKDVKRKLANTARNAPVPIRSNSDFSTLSNIFVPYLLSVMNDIKTIKNITSIPIQSLTSRLDNYDDENGDTKDGGNKLQKTNPIDIIFVLEDKFKDLKAPENKKYAVIKPIEVQIYTLNDFLLSQIWSYRQNDLVFGTKQVFLQYSVTQTCL